MIDELTKKHTDSIKAQVASTIDFHFNELVVKPYQEMAKLPEDIFVGVFLPFFCGEKSFDSENDIIVRWISIAGNPAKEVQIIDTNGEVLFTVPPIMDTTCIDFKNDNKGQALGNIIANYELHKNQLPIVGKNYLESTIDNRLKTLIKDSDALSVNEKRWNEIFIKYGKVKDTSVKEDANDRLSDDEIVYD